MRTSFITSFGGDTVAQTSPELTELVNDAVNRLHKAAQLPKYEYPPHIVTAAMMQRYSRYGVDFRVRRGECVFVGGLDAQKEHGKEIYGGGLLLSDRAAAEHSAAERAAAEKADVIIWGLSERERSIVAGLK